MFFRFNIFFLAVLFAVNLWASAGYEKYAGWFGIVFSLALVIAAKAIVKRWKFVVLPVILVPGSVLLLSLVDSPVQMRLLILFSALVFYLTVLAGWRLEKYGRDETAKAMYNIATVTALFCWYAASYGWYLNIPVPIWGLMLVFSVVTFFVSMVSFSVNSIEPAKRLIYSVFLALLITQAIWVQNFWPFGYLTTSVITLIIYYVSWSIILGYFRKNASFRAILFDLAFLFGAVLLLLLSTKWYPVV